MKQKLMAILVAFVLTLSLTACGEEAEETTLTGMVVSVEGTVISLMETDSDNMGGRDFAEGERPEMPEGMEDFRGFGDFNPEDFDGTMPEGSDFPQWGEGERPEGGDFPQWGDGEMPEDFTMPEDGSMPDFGGNKPDFGDSEAMGDAFENFASDVETKDVDIGNAHISVEIDGGKASGSIDDIQVGTFVTITMNAEGKVTNVLVSSRSSFGGGRRSAS